MSPLGVYLHVPFCASKCPYCDFYSLAGDEAAMDAYTAAALAGIDAAVRAFGPRRADTLYLGGGTPSLLGAARLGALIGRARSAFGLSDAEVTVEVNPADGLRPLFDSLAAAGVGRLSMGLQSAVSAETAFLGRRHTPQQAAAAVRDARAAGIGNISLDLMLGIPQQTAESVEQSIDFCAALGVDHISAYLLKVEEGTPFARRGVAALCPDEDAQADIYLRAVELLGQRGYRQYEISNFARPGRESRHNLKYWNREDYLGIGPAAHGCVGGARYYFPRDLRGFVENPAAVLSERDDVPLALEAVAARSTEGAAGPEALGEYLMLRLRLAAGLDYREARARFPAFDPSPLPRAAAPMARAGLCRADENGIALTPRGFLVSNAVIARLLDALPDVIY